MTLYPVCVCVCVSLRLVLIAQLVFTPIEKSWQPIITWSKDTYILSLGFRICMIFISFTYINTYVIMFMRYV